MPKEAWYIPPDFFTVSLSVWILIKISIAYVNPSSRSREFFSLFQLSWLLSQGCYKMTLRSIAVDWKFWARTRHTAG